MQTCLTQLHCVAPMSIKRTSFVLFINSLKEVSGKSDKKAESAEVLSPTQRKAMALVENALWKRVPFYLSRVRHQAVTSCITWLVLWSTKLPADPLGAAGGLRSTQLCRETGPFHYKWMVIEIP